MLAGVRLGLDKISSLHSLAHSAMKIIFNFCGHTGYVTSLIIIIITDLYSAFRPEDTEALDAAQED